MEAGFLDSGPIGKTAYAGSVVFQLVLLAKRK
jgi:hypothetical protein